MPVEEKMNLSEQEKDTTTCFGLCTKKGDLEVMSINKKTYPKKEGCFFGLCGRGEHERVVVEMLVEEKRGEDSCIEHQCWGIFQKLPEHEKVLVTVQKEDDLEVCHGLRRLAERRPKEMVTVEVHGHCEKNQEAVLMAVCAAGVDVEHATDLLAEYLKQVEEDHSNDKKGHKKRVFRKEIPVPEHEMTLKELEELAKKREKGEK